MAREFKTILVDTRQQAGKHEGKHDGLKKAGYELASCKVYVGDYCKPPSASVDTKRDIYELASDIDNEHDRFRGELLRAQECGCRLTVLVENEDGVRSLSDLESWEESQRHFKMRVCKSGNTQARLIRGERLAKACRTMQRKYGVRFEFCEPSESYTRIIEILEGAGDGGDS